jgi:hypothetical protein
VYLCVRDRRSPCRPPGQSGLLSFYLPVAPYFHTMRKVLALIVLAFVLLLLVSLLAYLVGA